MAKIRNLIIEQGASFSKTAIAKIKTGDVISLRPLEGYTGRASLKKTPTSSPIATFDVVVDPITSAIAWSLSAAQTSLLKPNCTYAQIESIKRFEGLVQLPETHPLFSLVYYWDLDLILNDYIDRCMQGMVAVSGGSTS